MAFTPLSCFHGWGLPDLRLQAVDRNDSAGIAGFSDRVDGLLNGEAIRQAATSRILCGLVLCLGPNSDPSLFAYFY